mmetsp:Transcript_19039/g.62870  ORF Transcript_19039/g.62870 Transcript_19039/m.62870 type:complete len:277 (+) Transcript_19039:215-1045(+)
MVDQAEGARGEHAAGQSACHRRFRRHHHHRRLDPVPRHARLLGADDARLPARVCASTRLGNQPRRGRGRVVGQGARADDQARPAAAPPHPAHGPRDEDGASAGRAQAARAARCAPGAAAHRLRRPLRRDRGVSAPTRRAYREHHRLLQPPQLWSRLGAAVGRSEPPDHVLHQGHGLPRLLRLLPAALAALDTHRDWRLLLRHRRRDQRAARARHLDRLPQRQGDWHRGLEQAPADLRRARARSRRLPCSRRRAGRRDCAHRHQRPGETRAAHVLRG